jgi:hypothetical protein
MLMLICSVCEILLFCFYTYWVIMILQLCVYIYILCMQCVWICDTMYVRGPISHIQ